MLSRSTLFLTLLLTLAFTPSSAGDSTPPKPIAKTLAVNISAEDGNSLIEALDLRDLEHFIVAELKNQRVTAIPFSSIPDDTEVGDGQYLIEIGIDQAEIAKRPRWSWSDNRYLDDEVLHLEISLSVSHLKDTQDLGSFNYFRDYRAEEYGRFSTPQAIRGAVYDAVTHLASELAAKARQGEFGADIEEFEHPIGVQDLIDQWRELSLEMKAVSIIAMLGAFVIAFRICLGLLVCIFGKSPRTQQDDYEAEEMDRVA